MASRSFAPTRILRYHSTPVPQRRTYLFSGHVQGVGFRYTTQSIAKLHPVTGYVRNLADGRVELVMEGEAAEMQQVVSRLSGQMEGHISRVTESESPATGEFRDFSIRHG
jgi:acylphosphatase